MVFKATASSAAIRFMLILSFFLGGKLAVVFLAFILFAFAVFGIGVPSEFSSFFSVAHGGYRMSAKALRFAICLFLYSI